MAPYLQRFGDFKRENAFHEAGGKGYRAELLVSTGTRFIPWAGMHTAVY